MREISKRILTHSARGPGPLEVALSARVVFLSLLPLTFPMLSQQSTMSQPVPGNNWASAPVRPEPSSIHRFSSSGHPPGRRRPGPVEGIDATRCEPDTKKGCSPKTSQAESDSRKAAGSQPPIKHCHRRCFIVMAWPTKLHEPRPAADGDPKPASFPRKPYTVDRFSG